MLTVGVSGISAEEKTITCTGGLAANPGAAAYTFTVDDSSSAAVGTSADVTIVEPGTLGPTLQPPTQAPSHAPTALADVIVIPLIVFASLNGALSLALAVLVVVVIVILVTNKKTKSVNDEAAGDKTLATGAAASIELVAIAPTNTPESAGPASDATRGATAVEAAADVAAADDAAAQKRTAAIARRAKAAERRALAKQMRKSREEEAASKS